MLKKKSKNHLTRIKKSSKIIIKNKKQKYNKIMKKINKM